MPVQPIDTASAAWLAAIPCALVTAGAAVLLGPALGRLLLSSQPSVHFLTRTDLRPQPTEHARYLIVLAFPLLLALATSALVHARAPPRATLVRIATWLTQVALVVLTVLSMHEQYQPHFSRRYLSPATLIAAGLIATALSLAARSERLRTLAAGVLQPSRRRTRIALAAAVVLTAVSVMPGLNTDASIGWANEVTAYHMPFPFDETFAVLNGLTPLVDFTAQYGSLWPFPAALLMAVLGKTLFVFTIAMVTITGLAMLGVFGVLRRATRNSLGALALYLPFVATSFFIVRGTYDMRFTYVNYFGSFPMRYAGPYLLAWLTARRLEQQEDARTWPLFVAAGLVCVNNTDFGLAALGASVAALVWTGGRLTGRSLRQLGGAALCGLAGAAALLSLGALLRTGSLPQPGRILEYVRIFGLSGFNAIPLPGVIGLPLIIYGTYVAAIAVATVRAIDAAPNRVLTGMLAWSGVFGLGSAPYYLMRAHPDVLPLTFSAWALAIALLTVAALRHLAAVRRPRAPIALFAVLLGMGVIACSLPQTPQPWKEIHRLRTPPAERAEALDPLVPSPDPTERRFLSSIADGPRHFVVRHGAPLEILATTGHRIADAYGVVNVSPYTGFESLITREQLAKTLDALRDAGGNTILAPYGGQFCRILTQRGFAVVTVHGLRPWNCRTNEPPADVMQAQGLVKWVDTHHLHPRALQR